MRSRSDNESPAKAKPSSFFRILLSDITPRSTLMIPRKFISEWGDDLEHHVFLKAPAGSVWEVALETTNGDVWLQNGWPDFAAHYSLCFGHFLVFRYQGKSHFHVIILDNSAAEIHYPLSTSCSEQPYRDREDIPKRKEVAATDDGVESRERNGRILMSIKKTKTIAACAEASHPGGQCQLKNKENTFTTSNNTDTDSSEDIEETDESDNSCDLEASEESDSSCSNGNKRLRSVTSGAQEAGLLELVNAFKSKNPYFTLKMQPSYVSGKCFLGVPRNFIKEYISECHCDVILQNSDGITWAVKCNVFSSCAQFGVGWKTFARAHSLAVGDFCAFELINCSKNLFKVAIFRAPNL